MKKIIQTGVIISIICFFGCSSKPTNEQSNTYSNNHPTFQEQLDTFTKLGFISNPATDSSDIRRWVGHEEYEKQPYSLMYTMLGRTMEGESNTPLTNKCWDFDTEAIEGHGSYVRIIENLERIARGELKFEEVKDYVAIEEGRAWVSFKLNSDYYKWNLKVEDDWVDTDLFPKIVELTAKYNTKGRYTYFDTGGQNAVFGYEISDELEKIKTATRLKIEWLN